MAFPYLGEEGFELGTLGSFNSEVDTGAALDYPHFTELARIPGLPAPYRGAYCARVDLSKVSTESYVQEDDDWDMAADENQFFRFHFYVSSDITMANNDEFIIFALQSAGPVNEVVVVINYTTANGLRVGVGETSGSQFKTLTTGRWHTLELDINLDAGVGNDGSIAWWLNGEAGTTVSSLDQAAVVQGRLGVMGIDAGTTRGTILFDEVATDDTRLFPFEKRFPKQLLITKDGSHVFVGPGHIDKITLIAGHATDNEVFVYDTDSAYTSDASNLVAVLRSVDSAAEVSETFDDVCVERGCFIDLIGTNPRVLVQFRASAYGSDGAIRGYGARLGAPLG